MADELLSEAGRKLESLPDSMRQGLFAISVLAFVSFTASTTLFSYLTYKLVAWRFFNVGEPSAPKSRPGSIRSCQKGHSGKSISHAVDFALGIDGLFTKNDESNLYTNENSARTGQKLDGDSVAIEPRSERNPPNQFLILIYNLLLADMHQSMAFLLNVAWLKEDAILVGSATCFTQGWFVSSGDLASSMFIMAIAIHTYFSVVRKVRISHRLLNFSIISIWLFVYGISAIPIAATRNGASVGGFFVRAGSWCWMNHDYEVLRLVTHYLFIFIALATTVVLYTAIFISLRREDRAAANASQGTGDGDYPSLRLSHNPAFLIYPIIYVLCTLPLAVGRLASMTGAETPIRYLCFAGAMISSNGLFDCLLFGTTRNVIVFASKYDVGRADFGLRTFAFMQTPTNRRYGNMVWVQGGRRKPDGDKTTGGWWSWQRLAGASDSQRNGPARSVSEESLRGPAIQMDMVTSVVVEMDTDKERDSRYPNPESSASPSLNSGEKDYPRSARTMH
jgi:hypothetical protein